MIITLKIPDAHVSDAAAEIVKNYGPLAYPLITSLNPSLAIASLTPGEQIQLILAAILRNASYNNRLAVAMDAKAVQINTLDATQLNVDSITAKLSDI